MKDARVIRCFCMVAAIALMAFAGAARTLAVTVPHGFEIVTYGPTFTSPTSMAFASGTRLFVTEQSGVVRVVENGSLRPQPFIDLTEEVNGQGDRGLLCLALDPNFAINRHVYLCYTVDPIAGSPDEAGSAPAIGRITRYTGTAASGGLVADPASRLVLLGATAESGIPVCSSSHTVGMLRFAADGSLLASAGDGALFSGADGGGDTPECLPYLDADEDIGAFRAQNLDSLCGKILRINPVTGNGYATNPYYTGDATENRSKVFLSGLRNPFRFTIRPGTGGSGNPGVIYVGDVGWNWNEEIGPATAGNNMGWPCYEAFGSPAVYPFLDPDNSGCDTIGSPENPGALTEPLVGIHHSDPDESIPPGILGQAIVCGVFHQGQNFRTPYRGGLFFGDVIQSWIKVMHVDDNDQLIDVLDFATNANGPVFFAQDPATGDICFLSIFDGRINRIRSVVDPGDVDGNGVVNHNDMLEVLSNIGPCRGCDADLDGNDIVDDLDLAEVVDNWG